MQDINFTALPGSPPQKQTIAKAIIEGLTQLIDRAHSQCIQVMEHILPAYDSGDHIHPNDASNKAWRKQLISRLF